MIEGHVDQRELDEIKARYGIGGRRAGPGRFPVVLIKPSHYDSDGYVIQWWRAAPNSESLARLRSLFDEFREQNVLGDQVQLEIRTIEEEGARVRVDQLARELKDGKGLVILTGVQSKEFPRAMDLALPLRVAGVNVCMGGFHIWRTLSAAGGATPELQEAMNLGVSLYAGEIEDERLERVLRDAWRGELKPLYNYLGDPTTGDSALRPVLPASPLRGTIGAEQHDAGTDRPEQFSFSTVIVVPGQEPRLRAPGEVEQLIRERVREGTHRFFLTDDNLAANPEWEAILDRLIAMRERDKVDMQLTVQVDAGGAGTEFIEKAGRAGVRRVFIEVERFAAGNQTPAEVQARLTACQSRLLEWKRAGVIVFAGYVFGFPGDTRETVLAEIRTIQRELAIDLIEPYCLAMLPGAVLPHEEASGAAMTAEEGEPLCRDAWREYYTLEHMETVLRRAAGTGVDLDELTRLLLWFHFCVVYEKVDPLQSGHLRRKHRTDRRSMMPREGFFGFYRRYGVEMLRKQLAMTRLTRHLRGFTRQLEQG